MDLLDPSENKRVCRFYLEAAGCVTFHLCKRPLTVGMCQERIIPRGTSTLARISMLPVFRIILIEYQGYSP
jgi:hypothetical protein